MCVPWAFPPCSTDRKWDVLALLKVVGDHTDANALMRLLATPRYALGALDLKRLARRATDLNTEYRFRTLVEAGLAPPAHRSANGAHWCGNTP